MKTPNFVVSNQAFLLDVLCRRYPGRRPSDFFDLSEYDALRLDLGIAYRGYLGDKEHDADMLHEIKRYMVGIMRSNGARNIDEPPLPIPLYKRPEDFADEGQAPKQPELAEVLRALGGSGVIING